jgi:hypothetical protein
MWTDFINVLSVMFGGTLGDGVVLTSTGLWVYTVVVAAIVALFCYKIGYDAGTEGAAPAPVLGLLVRK